MTRSGPALLAALLVMLSRPAACADAPGPPRFEFAGPLGTTLRLEGSNRLRGEFWSFFDTAESSPVPNSNYSFFGNRLQLGLRMTHEDLEAFAQLQDSIIVPAPETAPGAGGQYWFNTKRETQHEVIFRQGWFSWRNAFGVGGLRTVLGRQIYRDGFESPASDPTLQWLQRWRIADRLVGPFDYTHVGRSFDGGQVAYDHRRFDVTAFGFVPTAGGYEISANREIPNIFLTGLSAGAKESAWIPGTIARLFWIYYDDHRPIVFLDNRPEPERLADKGRAARVHTMGAQVLHVHALGPGKLDVLGWASGQTGDWQSLAHEAWAYVLEAGYQLPDVQGAPWLRGGINRASGDADPSDDVHRTFHQLLPTARTYAQFPFYNMMNNQDVFLELVLRLHRTLALRTDARWLRATTSRDLVYAGGGATSQHAFGYGGTPTGGRNELAYLTDVSLNFTPAPFLTAYAYYGHAFGQGIIDQAYVGNDADYGYLELTVSF